MKTIFSPKHRMRDPKTELYGGELVSPFECPSRVDVILEALKESELGPVSEAKPFGMEVVHALHDEDYLLFLERAWVEWCEAGYAGEAIANVWPARRMQLRIPSHIDGKLGYYALASETAISQGTWEAALVAKDVALTGAQGILDGDAGIFSLCRPPGHHATSDMYGGYCFLNNAAIAAQHLLLNGHSRVAILDIDFHHGNGTQDIFYERDDVLFCSLHGDPRDAFPYFLGYADEVGSGQGQGFNANYPMPPATNFQIWGAALDDALQRISDFGADSLVVSLGVDAFEKDPISFFKLTSEDFWEAGQRIGQLHLPTQFVMEGGYNVDEIGINVANVLLGYSGMTAIATA